MRKLLNYTRIIRNPVIAVFYSFYTIEEIPLLELFMQYSKKKFVVSASNNNLM